MAAPPPRAEAPTRRAAPPPDLRSVILEDEEQSFPTEEKPALAPPPAARRAQPPAQEDLEDDMPAAPGVITHTAKPAPLWRRMAALAVDAAAVGIVVSLYLTVALAVTGLKPPAHQLSGLDAVMLRLHAWQPVLVPGLVLTILICLVYAAVFAVIWEGRTPGRRLLGLRLVDSSGLAPTPARASVRALLTTVSFAVFLGGFWLAIFDRKGQTLHDKLTSTFVVIPT